MVDNPIEDAIKAVAENRFTLQAEYNPSIPESESKAYEEKAYYLVKSCDAERFSEAYNFILMAGCTPEDATAEEIIRYLASDADSDYPDLRIEKVVIE